MEQQINVPLLDLRQSLHAQLSHKVKHKQANLYRYNIYYINLILVLTPCPTCLLLILARKESCGNFLCTVTYFDLFSDLC